MATLVWTDDKRIIGNGPIESRPMNVVEGVMKLRGHGCHGSNPIGLAVQKGI